MPFKGLKDKVVIVTGAASGIGAATCRRLVEEGGRVAGVDLAGEALHKLAAELGPAMLPIEADISLEADCAKYMDGAVRAFGAVHSLVNCAGIFGTSYLVADMPLEEFDRVHAVNVRGALIVMKAALRQMIAQGEGGAIVNVSSVGALRANRGSAHYGSSKRALIGLSNAAALENGRYNIRVNTICPGPIDTPMLVLAAAPRPSQNEASSPSEVPLKRIGEAAEAAALIAYLLSDEASYQTAGVYTVDGGMMH